MRDFRLEVFFSQWEFKARHHMTASDVQSMSIQELLTLGSPEDNRNFHESWLGYAETWGDPVLRELIAETYDTLSANHILCFAGAEEGIYTAMRVMLGKADHAIVTVPNYQAAETVPLEICEVSGVPLQEENDWHLDIEDIRRAIRPNTKLVSVNFPNNPTGKIIPETDFIALVDLCRHHNIYLFSDEVYRLLELDETKRIVQVADIYEKGISLNVMSKAYGLPGLRVGWLASRDTDLLVKCEQYKHYLSICNAPPSEELAKIALKNRSIILERNRTVLSENLVLLDEFFSKHEELFEWRHPDGSCVSYPRYIGHGSVEQFCRSLLMENGVLLLPASIYHSDLLEAPDDRFRIGFGRAGMKEGLQAFTEFIHNHRKKLYE